MSRSFLVFTPSRFTGGALATLRFVVASLALIAACLCTAPAHAAPITIDMVTVGNPGNVNDTTGYGAVNYEYRIGKYEVTIGQYTQFLNAVAPSDPYSLYNTSMGTDLNIAGISRSGTSGGYTYSVIAPSGATPAGASSPGNRPITYVSWFDAARFANWMHNGQGSGSTETGAYTLVDGQTTGTAPAKNPGAQFYIPTENEWYKAAYYSPVKGGVGSPGYYAYATQSDTAPGNIIGSGANQANYFTDVYSVTQTGEGETGIPPTQNFLTDVGAFTNSLSFYGTFDQTGNVLEWNDLAGAGGTDRMGWRGGDWWTYTGDVSSGYRGQPIASGHIGFLGFRLAAPIAPVPEPSTYCMALAGIACGGFSMWRRRKRA